MVSSSQRHLQTDLTVGSMIYVHLLAAQVHSHQVGDVGIILDYENVFYHDCKQCNLRNLLQACQVLEFTSVYQADITETSQFFNQSQCGDAN
jgi:hypothetical protein